MTEESKITIRDAFGNVVNFASLEAFESFVDYEREAWAWLEGARHDPNDMHTVVSAALGQLPSWVQNVRAKQWSMDDLSNQLATLYGTAKPSLLLSDHSPGIGVQTIRDRHDEDSGELAFALAISRCSLSPAANLRAAKIWNMLASPALIGPTATVNEHRRKLGALRGAFRRAINKAVAEHRTLLAEHKGNLGHDRDRYQDIAIRMSRIGARRADRIGRRADEAVEKIKATDNAFTLRMGLEAPVRYWRTKQKQHERAWKVWGAAVLLYLLAVGVVVYLTFPSIWNLVPVGEALSGRHILLVTSIGAALTLIFWVARLLIRIFLGERHLATDAEERRVMVQAYLALVKAGGATDAERSIILASLFRGAQDGIVREEGTQDFTLPAMLSKALDGRKTS